MADDTTTTDVRRPGRGSDTGSFDLSDEVVPLSVKAWSHDSIEPQSSYIIKPTLEDKFKGNGIKEIILQSLNDILSGKSYDSDNAKKWTIKLANDINENIRELRMKRYKHIVQVTLGELKGAGVKSGLRCMWDSETDGFTKEIFMNDTIFAVVVVFAVYLY